MKYSIVFLIKGKADKYNQKLVELVGPKFGENYIVENPLPSHITLKSPFELKNSEKLEKNLKEFIKRHHISKIKIKGFGNFKRFVSFMDVKFSKESLNIQKDLIKEIVELGIRANKFDKEFKPHATVAYGNTKETFDKIWNYLKIKKAPNFDLKFDNICILKKAKKGWKIYKTFRIQ